MTVREENNSGDRKLRLLTGTCAQLEESLAAGVTEAKATDPLAPIAVLLGGTLQRPYLQRRLAELTGGIINVHFLMPSELGVALGEKAMIDKGARPLPPLADRILLRTIVGEMDGYFEPVRETPGIGEALHRLTRELRGAGYDGRVLKQSLDGVCVAPQKEAAIASIFAAFLKRRKMFYGPDDCLLAAVTDDPPWERLFVYGPWQLPAALRGVLGELSAEIPVDVFLPTTGTDSDVAHVEIREWLEAEGCTRENLPADNDTGTSLAKVNSSLFSPPTGEATLDDTVRMASAPDPAREVREVVRACIDWARDGILFHEIAVVYRNPEPYRALLDSVLREAGIPVYLHEGSPLSERPLGRRALALLDLVSGNLERRQVMDFVADSHFPKETWETYDKVPSSRWDRLSREAGIVAGLDQWETRLIARKKDLESSDQEWLRKRAEQIDPLLSFVRDLDQALNAHPAVAPWSEHLKALGRLLDTYLDDPAPIVESLEGLARFNALGETVSHERFIATIRSAIEELRSDEVTGQRPGAFARRGVNVLDVNSLRHLRFRAVAIVGLSERSFPIAPSPDPILLDDERIRLNEKGPSPIPLRVRGADPEPLQFAVAVSAAKDRLMATFPRKSAGENRPLLPSSFFRALAEAAVGERIEAAQVDQLPAPLFTRISGSRIGSNQLNRSINAQEYDRTLIEHDRMLGRAALLAAEPRIEAAYAARDARLSKKLTPYDGALSDEAMAALGEKFDVDRSLSVSRLHTYADCPHSFFLGSVLKAKPMEEPEETVRISAMNRGSLIHKILERFLGEDAKKSEEKLYGAGEEKRLLRVATEEFTTAEERGETGYPLLWRYERAEIVEDLLRWLQREREDEEFREFSNGSFEAGFGEWHYGSKDNELSSDKPLEIKVGSVKLHLSGQIDRINWDEEKTVFRVIDYKTGSASRKPKNGALEGGRAVQLPLYLYAGAKLLGLKPEQGSAELHYGTRRGGFERAYFTGEDLKERRTDLEAVLGAITGGMRDGTFNMAPVTERDCMYCDFDRLCPAGRQRQIARKTGDKRAAAMHDLREVE